MEEEKLFLVDLVLDIPPETKGSGYSTYVLFSISSSDIISEKYD